MTFASKVTSLLAAGFVAASLATSPVAFASSNTFVNENNISITTEEKENLLSLGFSEEEILFMDKEEFELNKDLVGEVIASSTKYIKVTEPSKDEGTLQRGLDSNFEFNSADSFIIEELDEETYLEEISSVNSDNNGDLIQPFAYDDTYDNTYHKKMKTEIIRLSATKTYRLKNTITWDRMPGHRRTDILGIGINSSYWAPTRGTEYGKQNWKQFSICNGTQYDSATYTSNSDKWTRDAGGYAVSINLPNNGIGGCDADRVEELSSYMYFTVTPLTNTSRLDAYGQYVHQINTINVSPSIALNGSSISISPSKDFIKHPNTHAIQLNSF